MGTSDSKYQAIMDQCDSITSEMRTSVDVQEPCSKAPPTTKSRDKGLVTTVWYGRKNEKRSDLSSKDR